MILGLAIALVLWRIIRFIASMALPSLLGIGTGTTSVATFSLLLLIGSIIDGVLSLAMIAVAIIVAVRTRGLARTGAILAAVAPLVHWTAVILNSLITRRMLESGDVYEQLATVQLMGLGVLAISGLFALVMIVGAILAVVGTGRSAGQETLS